MDDATEVAKMVAAIKALTSNDLDRMADVAAGMRPLRRKPPAPERKPPLLTAAQYRAIQRACA